MIKAASRLFASLRVAIHRNVILNEVKDLVRT